MTRCIFLNNLHQKCYQKLIRIIINNFFLHLNHDVSILPNNNSCSSLLIFRLQNWPDDQHFHFILFMYFYFESEYIQNSFLFVFFVDKFLPKKLLSFHSTSSQVNGREWTGFHMNENSI